MTNVETELLIELYGVEKDRCSVVLHFAYYGIDLGDITSAAHLRTIISAANKKGDIYAAEQPLVQDLIRDLRQRESWWDEMVKTSKEKDYFFDVVGKVGSWEVVRSGLHEYGAGEIPLAKIRD